MVQLHFSPGASQALPALTPNVKGKRPRRRPRPQGRRVLTQGPGARGEGRGVATPEHPDGAGGPQRRGWGGGAAGAGAPRGGEGAGGRAGGGACGRLRAPSPARGAPQRRHRPTVHIHIQRYLWGWLRSRLRPRSASGPAAA